MSSRHDRGEDVVAVGRRVAVGELEALVLQLGLEDRRHARVRVRQRRADRDRLARADPERVPGGLVGGDRRHSTAPARRASPTTAPARPRAPCPASRTAAAPARPASAAARRAPPRPRRRRSGRRLRRRCTAAASARSAGPGSRPPGSSAPRRPCASCRATPHGAGGAQLSPPSETSTTVFCFALPRSSAAACSERPIGVKPRGWSASMAAFSPWPVERRHRRDELRVGAARRLAGAGDLGAVDPQPDLGVVGQLVDQRVERLLGRVDLRPARAVIGLHRLRRVDHEDDRRVLVRARAGSGQPPMRVRAAVRASPGLPRQDGTGASAAEGSGGACHHGDVQAIAGASGSPSSAACSSSSLNSGSSSSPARYAS